ncbi:MAG: threonine synthase [Anaerolineae bacterium]|nr:threonine synthase [Anaerolineae bacterium]
MSMVTTKRIQLRCTNCGHIMQYDGTRTMCPRCDENILEAKYDLEALRQGDWLAQLARRKPGVWRYHELLPVLDTRHVVTMGEGGTPMLKAPNLGLMLGLKNLYIKDERQGPTGSFKDRQAAVAISVLREMGIPSVVVASTGNVAIAYAAYAARAGIKLWAFLTSQVPGEKMREVAIYGAEVIKVTGTYDETKAIAAQFAQSKGLFLDRGIKSIAAVESMKTMAFEIAEDLEWRAPDWFIQGVSGGMGPIGVAKGFEELRQLGLVDKVPALGIVQSEGCAPMVHAFKAGQRIAVPVENPQTIIATLSTGRPGRAYELLWALMQKYGGAAESASDEEAFEALRLLARIDGLSVEPATAVTFAGLFKMVRAGTIKPDDVVVLNCSGHTFPVEKHILGDQWAHDVDVSDVGRKVSLPEEGLLSALEQVDAAVSRVVVIEDTPSAARLISRILQTRGQYKVEIAEDGPRGIDLVRRIKPDVIITDLMMPGMDGFQVIDTLKADPELSRIPVIVLTAKELTPRERDRLSGQIDALLQKGGFLDEELLQSIVKSLQ